MFNSNSGIWSGAYITRPTAQFYYIHADWNVPGVIAFPGITPLYSAAAEWIGLDNSGTDLYQSGFGLRNVGDIDSVSRVPLEPFHGNYWIVDRKSARSLPGLYRASAVSPGDSVSVDIFVADQYGTTWFKNGYWGGLTRADTSVWFMLYNYTQGLSYWGTLPVAPETIDGTSSTGFTGTAAEFIVERPTVNGSAAPLANFLLATMHNCWYGDSQYGEEQMFALGADGSSPFDGNLAYLNMKNGGTGDQLDIAIWPPDLPAVQKVHRSFGCGRTTSEHEKHARSGSC